MVSTLNTITRAMTFSLLAGLLIAAAGCGGGGGNSGGGTTNNVFSTPVNNTTVSAPTPTDNSGRFVPNYNNEISVRHWNKNRLTVQLLTNGATPEQVLKVQEGFKLWEGATSNAVSFDFVTTPNADVTVNFVGVGTLGGARVGATTTTFRSAGTEIVRAQIQLDLQLTDDAMVQVASHEMGHALGIDGHSQNSADLMYPVSHLPVQITTRDANTILSQYATGRAQSTPTNANDTLVTTIACDGPAH